MAKNSCQMADSILENELLTVSEVADYLRLSRVTIWRWCKNGLIPAFQLGRNWRIRRNDLLALEDALLTGDGTAFPSDDVSEESDRNQEDRLS